MSRQPCEKLAEDYHGEGVFLECQGCGKYHPAPEIAEYQEKLLRAEADLSQSSNDVYAEFSVLESGGRWDINPDLGHFFFTCANGRKSVASYSLIGSWIEPSHSWMWGWALPDTHITTATRRAADCAHQLGLREQWPCLTNKYLLLNANEAWRLTDLAAALAGHLLVYRAQVSARGWFYFAMDRPTWIS